MSRAVSKMRSRAGLRDGSAGSAGVAGMSGPEVLPNVFIFPRIDVRVTGQYLCLKRYRPVSSHLLKITDCPTRQARVAATVWPEPSHVREVLRLDRLRPRPGAPCRRLRSQCSTDLQRTAAASGFRGAG